MVKDYPFIEFGPNFRKAAAQCRHFLNGPLRESPRQTLMRTAQSIPKNANADAYGSGELVEKLENTLARKFNKPKALFLPSGILAQMIALRLWTERSQRNAIGLHPASHIVLREEDALTKLNGSKAVLLGDITRAWKLSDVEEGARECAALSLEMPLRELGGAQSSWKDLSEISSWARKHSVALHLDGARIWESQPHYRKPLKEIAALFDSVYVSLYKSIGGISGACLLGDEKFIQEAKIWQRRYGGNVIHLYPFTASILPLLNTRIKQMPFYYRKAQAIASMAHALPGVKVTPYPPQANMFHLVVEKDLAAIEERCLKIARKRKIAVFQRASCSPAYAKPVLEVVILEAALKLKDAKIEQLLREIFV